VRWLDSKQKMVAEQSSKFNEQVEGWTELEQPRQWYRAKVNGLSASFSSEKKRGRNRRLQMCLGRNGVHVEGDGPKNSGMFFMLAKNGPLSIAG
jgi:hypothetical protein